MATHQLYSPPMVTHKLYSPPMATHQLYSPPMVTHQLYSPPMATHQLYSPPMVTHQLYSPPMVTHQLYSPSMATHQLYSPPMVTHQLYSPPMVTHQLYSPPMVTHQLYSPPMVIHQLYSPSMVIHQLYSPPMVIHTTATFIKHGVHLPTLLTTHGLSLMTAHTWPLTHHIKHVSLWWPVRLGHYDGLFVTWNVLVNIVLFCCPKQITGNIFKDFFGLDHIYNCFDQGPRLISCTVCPATIMPYNHEKVTPKLCFKLQVLKHMLKGR